MLTARSCMTGLMLSLCALACSADTLKYAIVSSQTLPLADITPVNGHYQVDTEKGFLILLGKEISAALNMELKTSVLPRPDLVKALPEGQVDMVCYQTPAWTKDIADKVDWTEPFMGSKDILVSKSKTPDLENIDDLKGKTIGLIKHYSYPLIDHLIESKDINPVYSLSEASNFIQLFKNPNLDAIVLKELTYEWLSLEQTSLVSNTHIKIHPLVIELIEPRCVLSRHKNLDLNKINQAIGLFKSKYGFD